MVGGKLTGWRLGWGGGGGGGGMGQCSDGGADERVGGDDGCGGDWEGKWCQFVDLTWC